MYILRPGWLPPALGKLGKSPSQALAAAVMRSLDPVSRATDKGTSTVCGLTAGPLGPKLLAVKPVLGSRLSLASPALPPVANVTNFRAFRLHEPYSLIHHLNVLTHTWYAVSFQPFQSHTPYLCTNIIDWISVSLLLRGERETLENYA